MLLKKPGQFAVGSATQSGAGLLDLNFLNSDATLSNTITHSRAGNATMVASDGLIKWAPHNLALNSASPATQSITVVSGADYTVECIGSGSITLSGAGTGTVTEGNEVEVTASTTTLTLTVSGSLDAMWCYRSDLGGMAPVPAGERSFPSASTYVPTTSSARYLPRVGHHVYNGSAWVNEGVLAESEARTNLFTYSSEFDNAAWEIGASTTLTADYATAPDGTTTAYRLELPATSGTFFRGTVSIVSGQTYTLSFWVKATSGTSNFAIFDFGGGSENSSGQLTATSEWQRFTQTFTATVTGGVFIGINNNPDTYASDILVWGAQLEAAPTPSSYIPTAGSTVTRAAETFTIPAANLPYNSLAMSIQMNGRLSYADEGSAGQVTYAQWEDDTNNRITLSLDTDSTATGEVNFTQVEGGTVDTVASSATEYAPGILVPFNIASRHGATFINGAVDGVALTANTTPTNLPDLSATDLDLAYDYMGTVERFRVWGLDLGDGGIEGASS